MTINVTSPVTGASQTGFTSPTYTLTADTAPDVNAKQWAVSALGGTQAGVTLHSIASPFTLTFWRPKLYRVLEAVSSSTGVLLGKVPRNKHTFLGRKGMMPAANQIPQIGLCRIEMDIPAGADTYSPAEVRALLSLTFGAVWQAAGGTGDTVVSGIM